MPPIPPRRRTPLATLLATLLVTVAAGAPLAAQDTTAAGGVAGGAQAAPTDPRTRVQTQLRVASPDGRNVVTVELRGDGSLHYGLARNGTLLLRPSRLGFAFRGAPPLRDGLRIVDTARTRHDSTFALPWGEVARVRDQHEELRVRVAEAAAPGRQFTVAFRAFDDGVAFRYELPEQPTLREVEIMEELTEFAMADDARAWWISGSKPMPDRQEQLYSAGPVSRLDTVHTPLTMETSTGQLVVLHEANLVDYAGMYVYGTGDRTLRTRLAQWKDGVKVRGRTPLVTPWRTLQLADRAADLAPSVLSLKLNPPSRIADARWVRPMKYNGVWWEMHLNTATWGSGAKHGATTANTRRYLDFAAANGLGGTLVEGWNVGWDGNWYENGQNFSFTRAYPDFDLPGLARYARSKGLTLIGHHETTTHITNYERQLDSAFALYARVGVGAVKTGYVGDTTDLGHDHQSQYMVRHHRRVIETAARNRIALVMHEPIKDTGERRTWPNMVSREGSRGMEYNAWSGEGGNPPEHESILFFTRMLAGPMDFTPGIFDLTLTRSATGARRPHETRPRTTLAKQLALYVVLYSPVQMLADLPESYAGQPALQFLRDVAVDWDTTRVLDGRIGDHVVVARREKGADRWFVGAVTDEEGRTLEVPLDFLTPGRRYVAEVYADGPGAHWRDNPTPVAISRRPVDASTRLALVLAPGGGQAIRIRPAP
jgi:alpha-glucosidase